MPFTRTRNQRSHRAITEVIARAESSERQLGIYCTKQKMGGAPRFRRALDRAVTFGNLFMESKIEPGMLIEFEYPSCNYRDIRLRFERRRLRVERVRNLADEPLDPFTLEADARLARGSTLVTGLDLDKRRERSFYLESMREVQPCEAPDQQPHVVELLEVDSSPELVFEGCADACVAAVREWLREPLGLTVSVRRIA